MNRQPGRSSWDRSAGFSVVELMVVVVMVGLAALMVQASWSSRRSRLGPTTAAMAVKTMIHRARMDAIFTGVDRFVVIDPAERSIEVYADSGATAGSFDDDDPRIVGTRWEEMADLALPPGASSITHPLESGTVTDAWSMPLPDSSARWGTELLGFTLTARGFIESAESTPDAISSGTIVFSNDQARVAAVSIRGRMGAAEGFELRDSGWKRL